MIWLGRANQQNQKKSNLPTEKAIQPSLFLAELSTSGFFIMANWKLINRYIGESEGFTSAPKKPGIYALILWYDDETSELVYIGTAKNLYIRLLKHEVFKVCWALRRDIGIRCIVKKCRIVLNKDERIKLERKFINRLKPRINFG